MTISTDYVWQLFHAHRMDTAAIGKKCNVSEATVERQLNRAFDERSMRAILPRDAHELAGGGVLNGTADQQGEGQKTWFCIRCLKDHSVVDGVVQCTSPREPVTLTLDKMLAYSIVFAKE